MPTVIVMIATVAVVTEFFKRVLEKAGIVLTKLTKVIVAVLASVGVVGYHWIESGEVFSFTLIVLLIQVAVGATQGYNLLRGAGRPPTQ